MALAVLAIALALAAGAANSGTALGALGTGIGASLIIAPAPKGARRVGSIPGIGAISVFLGALPLIVLTTCVLGVPIWQSLTASALVFGAAVFVAPAGSAAQQK